MDEIAGWVEMTDAEKRLVLESVEKRRSEMEH